MTSLDTRSYPVALVGNQSDRVYDRVVSRSEGTNRASEINCIGFYDISVREDVDTTDVVFDALYLNRKETKGGRTLSLQLKDNDIIRQYTHPMSDWRRRKHLMLH